jgi:hypothetical protein
MKGRRCRRQVGFKQDGQCVVLTCALREKHNGDHWIGFDSADPNHPGARVGFAFWQIDAGNSYVIDVPRRRRAHA